MPTTATEKAKAFRLMILVLKGFLGLFILIGIPLALYGAGEIWETVNFVKTSPARAKATFVGYHREFHQDRSLGGVFETVFEDVLVTASYPQFVYRAEDGQMRQVCESKVHVVELFREGEEVEILLAPHGEPRLSGFYALYGRDLAVLALGLGFILIPLLIGKAATTALASKAGLELAARLKEMYHEIASLKVGPFRIGSFLKGVLGLIALMVVLSLIGGLAPYWRQMRFGAAGRLIQALEQKRYDEAQKMIAQRKGIHATNEHDQSPLLLALEGRRPELARMLIEAGADVNIKSKMYLTPLRVATQSGDLEMVKLLLAKGASPDAPEDELPPFAYALIKGYDEIARVLIEGGTDLHRRYIAEHHQLTVGDMAVMARRPALVDLIRQRGGSFSD